MLPADLPVLFFQPRLSHLVLNQDSLALQNPTLGPWKALQMGLSLGCFPALKMFPCRRTDIVECRLSPGVHRHPGAYSGPRDRTLVSACRVECSYGYTWRVVIVPWISLVTVLFCCPLQLNAMANRAAGKGYENEDNYSNIKFQFIGIENINNSKEQSAENAGR